MFNVKFYLNNAKQDVTTIYVIVYQNSRRYKYPTGISIHPKAWNPAKMMCREKAGDMEARLVNERLKSWEALVSEVMNEAYRDLIILSQQTFREAVEAKLKPLIHDQDGSDPDSYLIDFASKFKDEVIRSERTIIGYETTISILLKFEEYLHKRIRFQDVDVDFYESLKKWMYSKEYSLNYFGSIIRNIKLFMSESAERGLHSSSGHKSKKFRSITEESDSIYLSVEKLKRLYSTQINQDIVSEFIKDIKYNVIEKRVASLIDCRDMFLIGAFTALRFSDFNVLEGLRYTDEFITKRAQKTGIRTMIPMHPIIREILLRREDQLPPPVYNLKMNKTLHLLGQIAGFNDPVQVTRTEGGRIVTRTVPEWQMITTHTARRSACTNMYLAGIPIRTIMSFSGHKSITNFMKYIKIEVLEDAIKMKDHPFFK